MDNTGRHGRAGDKFADAPFVKLERAQAPTRLGMNLFYLDELVIAVSPLGGLRPFPATLNNREPHDILPCLPRFLAGPLQYVIIPLRNSKRPALGRHGGHDKNGA